MGECLVKVLTPDEMKEIDKRAIEEAGIPGIALMENAGRAVAIVVAERLRRESAVPVTQRRVCIVCGKGNNGGDGFVAARHLANFGAKVKVFLLCRKSEVSGDAATNLRALNYMGIEAEEVSLEEMQRVKISFSISDILVDAIFGTGFKGEINGLIGTVIDAMNDSGRPIVSVDIPSGLDASTGKVSVKCVRATCTVTMGAPKLGLLLYPGAEFAGELAIANIGIPGSLFAQEKLKCHLLSAQEVRSWIPSRRPDTHKTNFGRVLVVAGSEGMTGAACLASMAALKSGAGLVTLAVPRSLSDYVDMKLTEVIVKPLPETESRSAALNGEGVIATLLERNDVLAIGPGMSMNNETSQLIRKVLTMCSCPVVADADALNAISVDPEILKAIRSPMVLTPHMGEMARLLARNGEQAGRNRLDIARSFAGQWGKVVVLKGAHTVISSPEGQTYINPTGNPGMATAGMGDVLTGIIAGLMAQGLPPLEAAAAGVYIHGLAGDLARDEVGEIGMVAGDVLERLPRSLEIVRRCEDEDKRFRVIN